MLFQSFDFLLFFPLVAGIYFLIPVKFRWAWILLASYAFYMFWNPWYILLLLGSTFTDYFAAQAISKTSVKKRKRRWLTFSLIVNLGLLGIFKYYNFFSGEFAWIIRHFNPDYSPFLIDLALPIGISFYTFQTIGYTLDVYNRRQKPITHLGKFAIYVSFFPQLVAGPIERARDLLPQLHFDYSFDTKRITEGLRLFLWGLFKKVVIADRLGTFVTMVFNNPGDNNGAVVMVSSWLFFFQLYYDFTAYQDMAVGTARVLGIRLSKNFEPLVLLTSSFRKFWSGWHITLTHWIKDFFYIPLSLYDKKISTISLGPIIMFAVVGLWHGANWTFIIWGILQGMFMIAERMMQPISRSFERKAGKALSNFIGFLFFFNACSFTLIFFRASSLMDAQILIKQIFATPWTKLNPGMFPLEFNIMLGVLGLSVIFEYFRRNIPPIDLLNFKSRGLRWVVYIILGLAIWFLRLPADAQFIYFEF